MTYDIKANAFACRLTLSGWAVDLADPGRLQRVHVSRAWHDEVDL